MTYSARMKVNVTFQVYSQKLVRSDKFKTGKEQYLHKEVISEDNKDVIIGRIHVMVNSVLCWMSEAEKGDCDFDHGGYFLIKGAEKEQICLTRLWVSSTPSWMVAYRSDIRRRKVFLKLVDTSKVENIGGEKVLSVYIISSAEVPVWILFFALGVSSDKEVVDLIDYKGDDAKISNILFASIHNADEKCEGFSNGGVGLSYIDNLIKSCKFPSGESIQECLSNYLFPSLS